MRQLILVLKLILAVAVMSGAAVALQPEWRVRGGIAIAVVIGGCGWLIYILEYRKDSNTAELHATADKERKKFEHQTTQTGDRILDGVGELKVGVESSQASFGEQRKRELAAKVMHLANQIGSELQSIRAVSYIADPEPKQWENISRLRAQLDSAILEGTVYFPALHELGIELNKTSDAVLRARAMVKRLSGKAYAPNPSNDALKKEARPIAFSSKTEDDETSLTIKKAVSNIREALSPYLDSR